MYNVCSFAQIFEGKLYMGIMIIYHGYNNPMYNAHENMHVHYTWEHIACGKIQYIPREIHTRVAKHIFKNIYYSISLKPLKCSLSVEQIC